MISNTGSAINARDFNRDTKDPDRDTWSAGAMHHLVTALDGAPVAIVLDKQTGFVEFNVTLGGVRENGRGFHEVLVERTHVNGTNSRCWYLLFKVGTVIQLGESGARWEALESYSEEGTRAVVQLQHDMMDKLGIENRDALPRGTWSVSHFPRFVHASFKPESDRDPVKFMWRRYSSAQLANA